MFSETPFFVCGSLVEGMVHYDKISSFVKSARPALTRGSVYRLEVGFPVFSSQGQHMIRGRLLELDSCETLAKLLDEFHGFSPKNPDKSLFHKVTVQVDLGHSQEISAFAYSVNPTKLPTAAQLIEDGDWERDFSIRPPVTSILSDREKTYIRKLGASTGRDIVPINLDLYRELMNKGLIVDKGRRLALTKLGQEVFRYLV